MEPVSVLRVGKRQVKVKVSARLCSVSERVKKKEEAITCCGECKQENVRRGENTR